MNPAKTSTEKGQTMVLVVIGFIVFVAVLALVLDGGNAYAAKRQAQNAADAGALAGATYMCEHRQEAGAVAGGIAKAQEFASYNGATASNVFASMIDARVTVTATVTKDTFFAGAIGFSQVAPRAVAAAECRPPGAGVMPVAWSCRENAIGVVDCAEDIGPCRSLSDPTGLSCTYILMDSVKVKEHGKPCDPDITDPTDPNYCYAQNDLTCSIHGDELTPQQPCSYVETGKIDCDLNNDCTDELMTGGARSWLDLNGGGGGARELIDWISGAQPSPILNVHQWVPEAVALSTSIFHATAQYLIGQEVVLPVFDKLCNGMPTPTDPETNEQCNAWTSDDTSIITNSTLNFHLISFSAFHVTCVQTGKNKALAEAGYFLSPSDKDCYGHEAAESIGSIDANDKTIEGYFVRQNLGGYGGPGDWFDTGTFTVVLVR